MKPIVQISLDLTDIDEALATAAVAMRAGVDWLEAGTPLILAEGLHGVRRLREAFPQVPIVADLKTCDPFPGLANQAQGFVNVVENGLRENRAALFSCQGSAG